MTEETMTFSTLQSAELATLSYRGDSRVPFQCCGDVAEWALRMFLLSCVSRLEPS